MPYVHYQTSCLWFCPSITMHRSTNPDWLTVVTVALQQNSPVFAIFIAKKRRHTLRRHIVYGNAFGLFIRLRNPCPVPPPMACALACADNAPPACTANTLPAPSVLLIPMLPAEAESRASNVRCPRSSPMRTPLRLLPQSPVINNLAFIHIKQAVGRFA